MEKGKSNLIGKVEKMMSKKRAREVEIPGDVLEEILARLPAKSSLRFAFVNTTWYSLIRNPTNFISKHLLDRAASGFDHVLLNLRSETTSGYSWMVSDSSIRNLGFVGNINKIEDPYIVGECNGLICFTSGSRKPNFDFFKPACSMNAKPDGLDSMRPNVALHLWNPATGQHRILPQSNILTPRPDYRSVRSVGMGFGHDPKSGDYKVVRFALYINLLTDSGFDMDAEVYSLRTDSWLPVAKVTLENLPDTSCGGVCLGGFCYWIGLKYGLVSTIISFDMSNDVFGQFRVPEQVHHCPDKGYTLPKLLVWKGSLALVLFPSPCGLLLSPIHMGTGKVRLIHIWSLEVDVAGPLPLTVKEHQDLRLDLDTIMDVDDQGSLGMDVELLCNDDLIIKLRNKGLQASSAKYKEPPPRYKVSSIRFKAYHISTGKIRNISLVGTYSFNTRMVGYTPSLVSPFP